MKRLGRRAGRRPVACLLLYLLACAGYAQQPWVCEQVVACVVDAFNTASIETVRPYLSEHFVLEGYTGETAYRKFKELITVPGKATLLAKTGETLRDNQLTLTYSFAFEKLGKRSIRFVFDRSNKLLSAALAPDRDRPKRP
jgi:hypothetical protein